MRVVIPVWATGASGFGFEDNVPLLFVGRRNRALGYSNQVDLLYLEGLGGLDAAYIHQLRDLGFNIIDAEGTYRGYADRFRILDRFGAFEKRCFLRWLVLADHYREGGILHLDGDVVFNECPEKLAALFSGRNLVLQGCPAVAAIGSNQWFGQYTEQLARFSQDIDGYSVAAWSEREGWEQTCMTRWAGCRYRRIITSDQDLISHLIHTDRIVQDDPAEFSRSVPEYAFFENPIHIGDWVKGKPLVYHRDQHVDFLNGQRIAVWHMQSDWCRYLGKYIVRAFLWRLAGSGRMLFNGSGWEEHLNAGIRKLTRGRWLNRRAIYQRYFVEKDFSGVLNDSCWWQEGVFESSAVRSATQIL